MSKIEMPQGEYKKKGKLADGEYRAIVTDVSYNDKPGKSGFPYYIVTFTAKQSHSAAVELTRILSLSPKALGFTTTLLTSAAGSASLDINYDFTKFGDTNIVKIMNGLQEIITTSSDLKKKDEASEDLGNICYCIFRSVKKIVIGKRVTIVVKNENKVSEKPGQYFGQPYVSCEIVKILSSHTGGEEDFKQAFADDEEEKQSF